MWIQMKSHFAVRSLEWFNAITLFSWGGYVSLHPGLFLDPEKKVLYTGLVRIMTQEGWGFSATIVALIQLSALFINGQWGLTPLIRCATSVLSVGAWFFVSAGIYLAGSNTGIPVYLALMLAGAYSAYRAASDAAEASFNKKLAAELAKRGLGETGNVRSIASRIGHS